jgi:hypothetical protein
MKITVLGCGNAFSTKNGNNCILLEDEEYLSTSDNKQISGQSSTRRMLIDAGWALPYMLERHKIDVKSITDVYVSHAHADHIGGLEFLGFSRYDWVNKPDDAFSFDAPTLIANTKLMGDLWEDSLKGGMSSLEGVDAQLHTFFQLKFVNSNEVYNWCGWKCRLIQQIHIMTGTVITNTFGLFMEKPDHPSIYFVTDSQHCSPRQIEVFYKKADMIFQDCECIGVDTLNRESKFMSGVHANFAQLAGWKSANSTILSDDIKAKMYLTHYQDFVTEGKDFFGNKCNWVKLAKDEGFKGFVHPGMTLEV